MKRLFIALSALMLVVTITTLTFAVGQTESRYGNKEGKAYWGDLKWSDVAQTISQDSFAAVTLDTLLLTYKDTSSSVRITGAKSVALFWTVRGDEGGTGYALTATLQTSADDSRWSDMSPTYSIAGSGTLVASKTYIHLVKFPSFTDSTASQHTYISQASGAIQRAAAVSNHLRAIISMPAAGATLDDTSFIQQLRYNVVH